MRSRQLAWLTVLLALTGMSHAGTIYVDGNVPGRQIRFDPNEMGSTAHPFNTVQDAIDASKDGDTIVVAPGHYLSPDTWQYDQIHFKGKNIRLVSTAPTDFSVVEKTVLCGVVLFLGSEGPQCLLQGFRIENRSSGGILGNRTHATISHCIISGNGPCGATVVKDCRGRISNCLIVDNTTFYGCDVQPVVSGCIDLVNCTIANNLSAVLLDVTDGATMHNCIVYGNNTSHPLVGSRLSVSSTSQISYSLIDFGSMIASTSEGIIWWPTTTGSQGFGRIVGDPCFVGMGSWAGKTLTEGDYHLKSQGYRWCEDQAHGSHWYFDHETSQCIDAGDPLDSLSEEPDRVPEDPEGRWGVNHAIDLGAYGGTSQASLAPPVGKPPGVGAVDLHDYWPLAADNTWSATADNNQTGVEITVGGSSPIKGFESYVVQFSALSGSGYSRRYSGPIETAYYVYVDYVLYKTLVRSSLDLLPQISSDVQVQFPQFLTIGSIIQMPRDPSLERSTGSRSVILARGTLAEVLAGTNTDPTKLLSGPWTDVLALRELTPTGGPGEPVIILAHGFGPLLWNGQPVTSAVVDHWSFPGHTYGGTTRR